MAYTPYTPVITGSTPTDDIDLPDDSELETSGVGAFDAPLQDLADRIRYNDASNRSAYTVEDIDTAVCVSSAATYASSSSDPANHVVQTALLTVAVGDTVWVECKFHAQCAVASTAEVRLGYVITSGSVNGIDAARANWGALADKVPGSCSGYFSCAAAGDLYVFLQVRSPGATNQINVYGPVSMRVDKRGAET